MHSYWLICLCTDKNIILCVYIGDWSHSATFIAHATYQLLNIYCIWLAIKSNQQRGLDTKMTHTQTFTTCIYRRNVRNSSGTLIFFITSDIAEAVHMYNTEIVVMKKEVVIEVFRTTVVVTEWPLAMMTIWRWWQCDLMMVE